jgi:hypothetical protein
MQGVGSYHALDGCDVRHNRSAKPGTTHQSHQLVGVGGVDAVRPAPQRPWRRCDQQQTSFASLLRTSQRERGHLALACRDGVMGFCLCMSAPMPRPRGAENGNDTERGKDRGENGVIRPPG